MIARWCAALLTLCLAFPAPAADPDHEETRALHTLFERQWEDVAQRFPEWATQRGDLRYNDRLTDESAEGRAAWDAQERRWRAEAKAIPRERLGVADRVSLDLFISELERNIEEQAFPGYRGMRIGALGGTQTGFAGLLQMAPMRDAVQAGQLLRRMQAYPVQIEQEIDHMRRAMALGWVPSKEVLDRALEQIDGQLPADVEASIVSEHYFTAQEGEDGALVAALRAYAPEKVVSTAPLQQSPQQRSPLSLLTFCVLVLRNGFTVTGESACASPENFDADIIMVATGTGIGK